MWDLSGQFPLGVQSVQVQVLQRAEQLALSRGAVQVQGQVRVALRDLDLAQVEESDSVWVQEQETVQAIAQARAGQVQQAHSVQDLMERLQRAEQAEAQVEVQGWVEAKARESALPQGYRLDSEEGLVRDSVQVTELELG